MRRSLFTGRGAAGAAVIALCGASLLGAAPALAGTPTTLPVLGDLGATVKLADSVPQVTAAHWFGAAKATAPATALVALQHRDQPGLLKLIAAVSNPHSAEYQHYLTDRQFDARFAPTAQTVATVEAYLKTFGLAIGAVPRNRAYVSVTGDVGQMSRAFDTTIDSYMRAGTLFAAPRTRLSIPAPLKGVITAVTGLDTGDILTPNIAFASDPFSAAAISAAATSADANSSTCVTTAPAAPAMTTQSDPAKTPPDTAYVNAAPFSTSFDACAATQAPGYGGTATLGDVIQGYTPQQLEGAYGVSQAIADGLDGAGETVVVIDAYSSPTMVADADQWSKNMGLPVPKLTIDDTLAEESDPDVNATVPTDVPIVGGAGEALLSPSGWFGEESLDVEAVHAIAPGANIVVQSATGDTTNGLEKAQNSAVEDDDADEISNSYGSSGSGGDATSATSDGYWEQAAAMGIGVQFSSGDDGDNTEGGRRTRTPASTTCRTHRT